MSKRRICFLTTNDFGFGGSEDLWMGTAKWLVRQGHDVSASVRRWEPCPSPLQSLATEGCRMLWRGVPPSERDLASVVQQRADLVVVAQGYQLEGLEWLRRLVAERIPFVVTNNCVHELGWPGTDDHRLEEFVRLHREALAFFFVSQGNKRLYEKFFGAELPNVDILRNPFKVSYDARPVWPGGDRLRLATVGRLECYHKGYDLLMDVLASPRWHERPVEVHLFGDGPHRELLGRLAARCGFPRIEFHGVVDDIEAVWRDHHVLVQPSRLEGMPLSIAEAMLCSRPVVATDVAGHRELVEDGVSGFIAEAASATHVGRALERLWEARGRLQEMGTVAAASARRLLPRDPCQEFGRRILDIMKPSLSMIPETLTPRKFV
jgi:glycosyltransferase involved in cell wall biosynthesis